MQSPRDDGSKYQPAEGARPLQRAEPSTSSRTIAFIPHDQLALPDDSQSLVGEDDRTVISQRPVAAPEEFYRSMPLSELAAMLEGRQLDHFTVEQMIGGGGMGAVFRGRDLRLDRLVAIKVIPAARRDLETLRRFRLEAQAAAKLDHPNIARVYYVGEAEQWNYIVFEFIDGVNIRDLVEMEGPLAVDDAVYYTRQVAEALQHAYEREVVHRDIKPSNVLVTASGSAKVVDMGLARNTALNKSTADETASGVTLGTFDYISPEQARNPRDADVRSDLYSLGCTLFYMLTGHPPFPEGTALQKLLSHGSQAPPDPRGWRDDLSDELYEITMKLMAKRPSDRYQTPAELISDLILLAEVEDLPRSQSPGTLMVTPNIAQHSLLETNLPWLVALAFLLGSTLWLASVEKLSNDFVISELDFASPTVTAATEDGAGSVESTGVGLPSPANEAAVPALGPTLEPLAPQGATVPTLVSPEGGLDSSGRSAPELPQFNRPSLPSVEAGDPLPVDNNTNSAATTSALVVSADLPNDVDPQQWESSLASAVQRLEYAAVSDPGQTHEIEVRGRVVLRRALEIRGHNLRIVGATGSGAVIELAQDLVLASSQASGPINVEGSQLQLQGIAIEVTVPDDSSVQRQGLFSLRGAAELDLQSCTVTVNDLSASNQVYVVSCNDWPAPSTSLRPRLAGLSSAVSNGTGNNGTGNNRTGNNGAGLDSGSIPSGQAGDSIIVRSAMSVFRGDTSLLRLNITEANLNNRVDLSLTNTLVAISGSVLELNAPTGEAQPQRNVRLLCDQSTLVSEQAFAQLNYSGEQMPLVGLVRTSQSCIYWSRPQVPHVVINGARRQSLLGNFNLLLLQGMNNLYDSGIEVLCQSYQGNEKIAAFGFIEAATSGWLAERGNEARIRWQTADFPKLPWREASPRDFSVADLLFVPGISAKTLPSLD